MSYEEIRRSFVDFQRILTLGSRAKLNRLKENLNYKRSMKARADSGSSDEHSSDEDSDYGAEYDYDSMSDRLIQFIMVEYSDGQYNRNWLKFFFKN